LEILPPIATEPGNIAMIFLALAVFTTVIYVSANPSRPISTSARNNPYNTSIPLRPQKKSLFSFRDKLPQNVWSPVPLARRNELIKNEGLDLKFFGGSQTRTHKLLCKLETKLQFEKVRASAEKARADRLLNTLKQKHSELEGVRHEFENSQKANNKIIASLDDGRKFYYRESREFELALKFCADELDETRAKYTKLREEHELMRDKFRKTCEGLEDLKNLARDVQEHIRSQHTDPLCDTLSPPMTPESGVWINSPMELIPVGMLSGSEGIVSSESSFDDCWLRCESATPEPIWERRGLKAIPKIVT
jgi:hypothetical protein